METLQRDPYLWQAAKARTKFQSHLVVYVAVNALLWGIWAFTDTPQRGELPWPVWTSVFWGFGLLLRGLATYGGFSSEQRTQRAYERLLREQSTADPLDKYR